MKDKCILCSSALLAVVSASALTVEPRLTDEILVNPGMGLIYYHSAGRLWAYGSKTEPGDALNWFPGVSTIYMRVLWNDLEPEEGEYRWDIIDSAAQAFVLNGKRLGIRVICCNQTENATPQYVRDAGAEGHSTSNDRWEPEYMDPVYLAKYEKFLRAFAAHYDGSPDVAFVDIGSVGLFGEGHSPALSKFRKDDPEGFNRMIIHHIDLHRRVLPNTFLSISDDVGGGGWVKCEDHPIFKHCREVGVGLRDDSIFCSKQRPWLSDHFARLFAPHTPVILEAQHYIANRNGRGDYMPDRVVECVEKYRASYFSIHDFPRPHLRDFGAALEKVSRRIGYRIAPIEIEYPAIVKPDEAFEIKSTWRNFGVAKCYRGAKLTWSLVNDRDAVCWCVTDGAFDAKDLPPEVEGDEGRPVERLTSWVTRLRFGHTRPNPTTDPCVGWAKQWGPDRDPGTMTVMLKPGKYRLCVSLGTTLGRPEIAMPIAGQLGTSRRYVVGNLEVIE